MAAKHFVLTLTGSVQRLSTVLAEDLRMDEAVGWGSLTLQPGAANAAVVHVGARPDVSSTDYMFRLEAAADGIPPAPFVLELGSKNLGLGDLYVIGANTEKLHVGVVGR